MFAFINLRETSVGKYSFETATTYAAKIFIWKLKIKFQRQNITKQDVQKQEQKEKKRGVLKLIKLYFMCLSTYLNVSERKRRKYLEVSPAILGRHLFCLKQ